MKMKGSRILRKTENVRKSRPKKRAPPLNRHQIEQEEKSYSTSAKKLKTMSDIIVPEDNTMQYRILNFITVFAAISQYVSCKTCGRKVDFKADSTRGLGFKILVLCESCEPESIPSCPYIQSSYEINRRFIFVMRLLGIGLKGCQKFCGLMDLPPFITQNTYDIILRNIHTTAKSVCELFLRNAVKEEIKKASEAKNCETAELTVSGDGTWKKRGFTSLFGIVSVIGYHTGKVLDVIIKNSYCKMCEYWDKRKETAEYLQWKTEHDSQCLANHEESAGKMEVDAIIEIFLRSEKLYGVKYINYIGDGDLKTYIGIVNSAPYGDTIIYKKECISHVQKQMRSRLLECKRQHKELGGKNKLTAKMIDKLTVYYGLAIRRHCNSIEAMKKAIWATYLHYSSTDEQPRHENCPIGADSWCSWQRANANSQLDTFTHEYRALPENVLNAIKPIYENLSQDVLLEQYIDDFTQNNNESFHNIIWKIAPKNIYSGTIAVELAAYITTCTFNEGARSLLQILKAMQVQIGTYAHAYVTAEDENRIIQAEMSTSSSTKEEKIRRRQAQSDVLEASTSAEDLFYDPGIDDSM